MLLSQVSIRRPILTTMMSLGLLIFGILGLSRLPVRELPDVDPPIVDVLTVYPGASATVVETEVTERLEEAINSIEGIKRMTSQSREQVSNVTVEFNLGRDIDVAAQDVPDRVSRIRGGLPEDILEPVVAKQVPSILARRRQSLPHRQVPRLRSTATESRPARPDRPMFLPN